MVMVVVGWLTFGLVMMTVSKIWASSACPHDVIAEIGQTVTFSAATKPGNELRWYKNNIERIIFDGGDIVPEYSDRCSARTHGDGTVDLTIRKVSYDDAGSYGYFDPFTRLESKLKLIVVESSTMTLKRLAVKDNLVQYEVGLRYAADSRPTVVFSLLQTDGLMMFPQVHTTATENSIKSFVRVDLSPTPNITTSVNCQVLFNISSPSCLQPGDVKSLHVQLDEQYSADYGSVSSIHIAYISALFALIALNVFCLAFCVVLQIRKTNRKHTSSKPNQNTDK
jgi:hypothetical protein